MIIFSLSLNSLTSFFHILHPLEICTLSFIRFLLHSFFHRCLSCAYVNIMVLYLFPSDIIVGRRGVCVRGVLSLVHMALEQEKIYFIFSPLHFSCIRFLLLSFQFNRVVWGEKCINKHAESMSHSMSEAAL